MWSGMPLVRSDKQTDDDNSDDNRDDNCSLNTHRYTVESSPSCLVTSSDRSWQFGVRDSSSLIPTTVCSEKASPPVNATERLTTKPPLCQECAKTRKHSPTNRGQSGHEAPAELGISRRYGTI
jgi:hypothetical protein